MKREHRYDFGTIRAKPTKTAQGFLKLVGNLTRVGVLTYQRADGSKLRELRLPEEVFKSESLASLAGAPITDLHPSGLVSPSNVMQHQKGFVGESVKQDGRFVCAPLIIQDAGLIAAVESGERRELSPGYTCEVEHNPGTWRGEKYDAVQRGIVYNHLAVGPRGWGRSGAEVALKMDGGLQLRMDGAPLADFVRDKLSLMQASMRDLAKAVGQDEFMIDGLLEGFTFNPISERDLAGVAKFLGEPSSKLFALVPVANRGDGGAKIRRQRTMETVTIHIDGIAYEVAETAGPHIVKALASRDARVTELQAKSDAAEARADNAEKSAKETQTKLDAAESPERLASAVTARVELVSKASKVLGAEVKLDGLPDQDIKLRCIKHTDSDFDGEGKSSEYVNARFDLIKPGEGSAPAKRKDDAVHALDESRNSGGGNTEDKYDSDAARARMYARNQDAWNKPLAASKDAK